MCCSGLFPVVLQGLFFLAVNKRWLNQWSEFVLMVNCHVYPRIKLSV